MIKIWKPADTFHFWNRKRNASPTGNILNPLIAATPLDFARSET
jgi:hypothetical protein